MIDSLLPNNYSRNIYAMIRTLQGEDLKIKWKEFMDKYSGEDMKYSVSIVNS